MLDISKAPVAPPWLQRRHRRDCLLCGQPASLVCVYEPGKGSPAAPQPPTKRLILYGLCEHCGRRMDELLEVIEAHIEAQVCGDVRTGHSSTAGCAS